MAHVFFFQDPRQPDEQEPAEPLDDGRREAAAAEPPQLPGRVVYADAGRDLDAADGGRPVAAAARLRSAAFGRVGVAEKHGRDADQVELEGIAVAAGNEHPHSKGLEKRVRRLRSHHSLGQHERRLGQSTNCHSSH